MSQPYKVCPRCGQPAVLDMPQCRRCGSLYPPGPSGSAPGPAPIPSPCARPLSPAAQRERPRAPLTTPRRRPGWIAPAAVCLVLALAALGTAALVRSAARSTPAGGLVGAAAPPALPNTGLQDPTAGMFVERPGRSETPTVLVTNEDEGNLTMTLYDDAGHPYQAVIRSGDTATLRVPAGHYTLYVSSDNPTVHANTGDATFRPYKEYTATIVDADGREPIHLGD